jgi:quercetin dioxygenase-like cupin family protein
MKILHYQDVAPEPVQVDGACGTTIRWLISKDDGAPSFAMRLFELAPEGTTPLHTHAWEHEVFILEGTGEVWHEGAYVPVGPGTAIFVPAEEKHCFRNTGRDPLTFLCLVPVSST